MGSAHARRTPARRLPQGTNAGAATSSRSRASPTCCCIPATSVRLQRRSALTYPDIRLVYWAGGNPFHHHQDLNRLRAAWRKPETIVVHEQFWTPAARNGRHRAAGDDQPGARRHRLRQRASRYLIAMKKAREPVGEARDDYCDLRRTRRAARRTASAYTEGRDAHGSGCAQLYEQSRETSAEAGVDLPAFDEFWEAGIAELPRARRRAGACWRDFRADPASASAQDAVGQDRDLLRDASPRSATTTAPAMRSGCEPVEWLGAETGRALSAAHAVGPAGRQAAQPARPQPACARDQGRRAASRSHASRRTPRRAASPTATCVRVFNDRGACLAAARLSDAHPPRRGAAVDRRLVRPGDLAEPAAREARQSQRADARHRRLAS